MTTRDAGMAVPDWPNTYGRNLLLYPWKTWLFGPWDLLIEHGHRLLGALAGLVTIGLVWSVFVCESRRWMRPVALGTLLLVILQGSLGGARVLLDERQLAMLHGCVAHAFFSLAVALAVVTSRWWRGHPTGVLERLDPPIARRITRLTIFTCALASLQILLGAWLRHIAWYDTAGMFRTVLWMHLFTSAAIAIHAILLWNATVQGGDGLSVLKRSTQGLVLLVCIQIGLGCATWVLNYSWPGPMGRFLFAARHVPVRGSMSQSLTTTAHVAVGSLILALSIQTAVRWFRILWCYRSGR